jgi:hypothetical protein
MSMKWVGGLNRNLTHATSESLSESPTSPTDCRFPILPLSQRRYQCGVASV